MASYDNKILDNSRVTILSGTPEEWAQYDPILYKGEMGLEENNEKGTYNIKFGDGVHKWSELNYFTGKSDSGGVIDVDIIDGSIKVTYADGTIEDIGTVSGDPIVYNGIVKSATDSFSLTTEGSSVTVTVNPGVVYRIPNGYNIDGARAYIEKEIETASSVTITGPTKSFIILLADGTLGIAPEVLYTKYNTSGDYRGDNNISEMMNNKYKFIYKLTDNYTYYGMNTISATKIEGIILGWIYIDSNNSVKYEMFGSRNDPVSMEHFKIITDSKPGKVIEGYFDGIDAIECILFNNYQANRVAGNRNTVFGYSNNLLGGNQNIVTGQSNTVTGLNNEQNFITGGTNTISGSNAAISRCIISGLSNEVSPVSGGVGYFCNIISGTDNSIKGSDVSDNIIAGYTNVLNGSYSSKRNIIAGTSNNIANHQSCLLVGEGNGAGTRTIDGRSIVSGGDECIICGVANFIETGFDNNIIAGSNNTLRGTDSIVCGTSNILPLNIGNTSPSSAISCIVCGTSNKVNSYYGIIAGSNNNVTASTGSLIASSSIYVAKDAMNSVITGQGHYITSSTYSMIFGNTNKVGEDSTSSEHSIIGGTNNIVPYSTNSMVIGFKNTLSSSRTYNSIIAGNQNTVTGYITDSIIISNETDFTSNIDYSIISGKDHTLAKLTHCIIGGHVNTITTSSIGDIISGTQNKIDGSSYSIYCGRGNTVSNYPIASFIGGTSNNIISPSNSYVSGTSNKITGSVSASIVTGIGNTLSSITNSIISGFQNTINSPTNGIFVGMGLINELDTSITSPKSKMIIGTYNTNDSMDENIIIVGNGSSSTVRTNAMTLTRSGDLTVSGTMKLTDNTDAANPVIIDLLEKIKDLESRISTLGG